jgi:hypothetical protein
VGGERDAEDRGCGCGSKRKRSESRARGHRSIFPGPNFPLQARAVITVNFKSTCHKTDSIRELL